MIVNPVLFFVCFIIFYMNVIFTSLKTSELKRPFFILLSEPNLNGIIYVKDTDVIAAKTLLNGVSYFGGLKTVFLILFFIFQLICFNTILY